MFIHTINKYCYLLHRHISSLLVPDRASLFLFTGRKGLSSLELNPTLQLAQRIQVNYNSVSFH